MIDCGATGLAFIHEDFVRHHHLPTKRLQEVQEVVAADGHAMKPIERTVNISLKIKDHVEKIQMFVTDIGSFNLILGMPWLQRHNPDIDWSTKTINWRHCPDHGTTEEPPRPVQQDPDTMVVST